MGIRFGKHCTGCRWVRTFMPWPFYSREYCPRHPLHKEMDMPQRGINALGKTKILLSLLELKTRKPCSQRRGSNKMKRDVHPQPLKRVLLSSGHIYQTTRYHNSENNTAIKSKSKSTDRQTDRQIYILKFPRKANEWIGCKKNFERWRLKSSYFASISPNALEIRCNIEAGSGQQKDGRRAHLVPGTAAGNSFHSVCSFMQVIHLLN